MGRLKGIVMTDQTSFNPSVLHTSSLSVSQESVAAYAELTNDFNPIHLDAAFAATTPMGRPIAHGTMSLALLWQSLGRSFTPETLASLQLDVRFIRPVFIGEQITAGGERVEGSQNQWQVWVRADDGADRIVGVVTTTLAVTA